MSYIEHNPYNALGNLFLSLEQEKQRQILEFASNLKPSLEKSFRQYFYKDRRSNPSKLPEKLKVFLKEIDSRFSFCFVPNYASEIAIKKINKDFIVKVK